MSGLVKEINEKDFQKIVLDSKKPVIIDFWASWCGPCKIMGEIFDELASDLGKEINFVKVDVDKNSNLAAKYQVMSIPTLIIFKDGKSEDQLIGIQEKEELKEKLMNLK